METSSQDNVWKEAGGRERMCVQACKCAHVHPSTCVPVYAHMWKLEAKASLSSSVILLRIFETQALT